VINAMSEENVIEMDENAKKAALGFKVVGAGVLVIIGLSMIGSFWFQVSAESVGVVTRFGKFQRIESPGLHFKLPLGIEQVQMVETERQHKEEFGFRTVGVKQGQSQWEFEAYRSESIMLTGDLNVMEIQWAVQYRIRDPYKFLFRVRNVQDTFRHLVQAVMREVVGDRTVRELMENRSELTTAVQGRLSGLVTQYDIGITVEQVLLLDVTPPDQVKPAFNEVNQAQQEKEKTINQARTEYNTEVPRARGEADQRIQRARGYAINRTNGAEGEANRFKSMLVEYEKAPEVTRQRIYIETMSKVLPRAGHRIVIDQDASNFLPLLRLDQSAAPKRAQ
jgi:membrane protease subunit HflK